jgi:hypothetical protein
VPGRKESRLVLREMHVGLRKGKEGSLHDFGEQVVPRSESMFHTDLSEPRRPGTAQPRGTVKGKQKVNVTPGQQVDRWRFKESTIA